MKKRRATSDSRLVIQAVVNVGQILRLMSAERPTLSIPDVANELGIDRTTAYRYFASLVSCGLMKRIGTSREYEAGDLLIDLSGLALSRRRISELALPYMQQLADETRATAVLSLWGDEWPVHVRTCTPSNEAIAVIAKEGHRLSLEAAPTALLLAFHPNRDFADDFLSGLAKAERDQLRRRIEEATADRFASREHARTHLKTLAAPIFGEYGIAATLMLIGTDREFGLDRKNEKAKRLLDVARVLTDELGGSFDWTPIEDSYRH